MADDPRVLVLAEMRKQTALLGKILECLQTGIVGAVQSATSGPAVNLNGPHGDPLVKAKDPRDWTGEPMNGRRFSECPPEYLDLLADRFDYFAERETDASKQRYNRLDAGRARGWAARLRNGYEAPAPVAPAHETEPRW